MIVLANQTQYAVEIVQDDVNALGNDTLLCDLICLLTGYDLAAWPVNEDSAVSQSAMLTPSSFSFCRPAAHTTNP